MHDFTVMRGIISSISWRLACELMMKAMKHIITFVFMLKNVKNEDSYDSISASRDKRWTGPAANILAPET